MIKSPQSDSIAFSCHLFCYLTYDLMSSDSSHIWHPPLPISIWFIEKGGSSSGGGTWCRTIGALWLAELLVLLSRISLMPRESERDVSKKNRDFLGNDDTMWKFASKLLSTKCSKKWQLNKSSTKSIINHFYFDGWGSSSGGGLMWCDYSFSDGPK